MPAGGVEKFIHGYRRFYQQYFVEDEGLYWDYKTGVQTPEALIITCSDSRVDPAIVTDSSPGDLFVIRNVANMVPPYQPDGESLHGVSAALEFGVCHLNVPNIIIMGHSGCAGISALREGISPPSGARFSFITPWVEIGEKARKIASREVSTEDKQTCCEQEAIKISLQNLLSFPWIKKRVDNGTLKLHGWYFRLNDGELLTYQEHRNGFIET